MRFSRTHTLLATLSLLTLSRAAFGATRAYVDNRVRDEVHATGGARVIIQMGDTSRPKIWAADWKQRVPDIRGLTQRVVAATPKLEVKRTYDLFPFLAAKVDTKTLEALAQLAEVEAIYPDRRMQATLGQSGPLVGQPAAETAGYTGAGIGVAVLDTGIDYTHSYLATPDSRFFTDVLPGHWAWRYVEAVAEAGVVGGYGDQTYRPGLVVSRDQMAVFVARGHAGSDAAVPSGPATPSFTDVGTGYWAYRYVEYCREQGIVGGFGDGTYRPTLGVDRGQMAIFIARADAGGEANVPPGPGTATFIDIPTDHWAFKYVEYCEDQGIVGGYGDGTYRPTSPVTRDQMSVFMARAFDYTWGGRVIGGVNMTVPSDDPARSDPRDDHYHGTMVAGIIASMDATNRGMAPGANLVAVKVLDSTGSGWSSDVIAGIQWCITNQAAYGLKAINMSLGDGMEWTDPETCDGQPEGIAITDAVNAGLLVAVASGNESYTNGISMPACASAAVSVGATNDGGPAGTPVNGVSSYSDRGELMTMYAPGTMITSSYPGDQVATGAGTSFASPHVAGAAAVLAQMGITDPAAMRDRLTQTGLQIVDPATNVASPRLDLAAALSAPPAGKDLVVDAVSSPAASAFVGDNVTLNLTVRNQGTVASTSCQAVIVLTKNRIASRQDAVLATVSIPAVSAGGSYATSVAGTVPAMNGGAYHLGAYADSGHAVAESNEVNNARANAGTFAVSVPSALAVSITGPTSLGAGQTTSITVRMKNDGSTTWTTGSYSLGSAAPEGNGTWGVSNVALPSNTAPGGTAVFTFNITAPATPGTYACCWRMKKGSAYFGEVAAGLAKDLAVNDATYGQDFPAVSGDRVAFMDYNNVYAEYGVPAISVKNEVGGLIATLPEDISFPIDPGTGGPYPPYAYFDISNHYYPSLSGTWATWMVDDRPSNPSDPYNSPIWYLQVTAYDLSSPSTLPRRVTLQDADAWFPTVDQVPAAGNHYCAVWEDYRNDPDKIADPSNFLLDNSDVYLSDLNVITDATNHRTAVYPICTAPGPQFAPRISGNLIVWEDWRDEWQADIYGYDLSVDSDSDGIPNWKESVRPSPDPAERRLTDTAWAEGYPDISGRTAVYADYSTYIGPGSNVSIISQDVDTLVQTLIVASPPAYRQQARVDGTQVVWEDWRSGEADVYWTDLANPGVEFPIAGGTGYEGVPDLAGGRLVFAKHRSGEVYNVYYQRLTPYIAVTP
jgi:beta propeller repeat protein